MFYRIKDRVKKAWFKTWCRNVLRTPPISPVGGGDDVLILSGVGNRDLLMYLVAIKSFYHFFNRGRVLLLVQDNCPESNLEVLMHHVNPLRIVRDSEVKLGRCPHGGTWERLVSIVREVKDRYVIQLDSDTVTFGEIPEVKECVSSNTSFMIGTWRNQELEGLQQASKRVRDVKSTHVQMLAEKSLDRLPGYEVLKYARGQSSFAGFAKASCTVEALEQFSEQMENIVGHSKWREWGSESVASNFMIANAPAATILPHPKYATYMPPSRKYGRSSLVHFEGTNRFKHGFYIEKARSMIDRINGS
jgi:hypothetical protein